jgi:hypothetical protein
LDSHPPDPLTEEGELAVEGEAVLGELVPKLPPEEPETVEGELTCCHH